MEGSKPIPNLRIGEAFMWEIDNGIANRSDQSAVAYQVEAMPADLRATLRPADRHEWWAYDVYREDVWIALAEECYESKEGALAGLQTWLQSWLARTP